MWNRQVFGWVSISGYLGTWAASPEKSTVRTVRLKTKSRPCLVQWRLKRIPKGIWSEDTKMLMFCKEIWYEIDKCSDEHRFQNFREHCSVTWQEQGANRCINRCMKMTNKLKYIFLLVAMIMMNFNAIVVLVSSILIGVPKYTKLFVFDRWCYFIWSICWIVLV